MPGQYSIFATVGNATQPFDRFVQAVDEAARIVRLPTLIQTGRSTYRPRHAAAVDFVDRSEFEDLIRSSDYVATHGGVGSVLSTLHLGKVPMVMVRYRKYGEVVNDHQLELVDELSRLGLVHVIAGADQIVELLRRPPEIFPARTRPSNSRMLETVRAFLS